MQGIGEAAVLIVLFGIATIFLLSFGGALGGLFLTRFWCHIKSKDEQFNFNFRKFKEAVKKYCMYLGCLFLTLFFLDNAFDVGHAFFVASHIAFSLSTIVFLFWVVLLGTYLGCIIVNFFQKIHPPQTQIQNPADLKRTE